MSRQAASDAVAAKTRRFRKALRWSVRELSERSGLPEDSINDIELGRRRRGVLVDELVALAGALGRDPAALLPDAAPATGADESGPFAERVAWLEGEVWRLRSGMRELLKGGSASVG